MFKDVEEYINQIPYIHWNSIDKSTWLSIKYEGLDIEFDARNPKLWKMGILNISNEDSHNLKFFDNDTVDKFNRFDIALKETFNMTIIDLIDYENGTVKLITIKSQQDLVCPY